MSTGQGIYAIGLDMGGTRLKGVAVSSSGDVLDRAAGETGETVERFVRAVGGMVRDLAARRGSPPGWIGLAAPGLASRDGTAVAALPNRLPGLEGLVWTDALRAEVPELRLPPVVVLNDAQAALLGEAWTGAAAGCRDVVLFTLGTGVGGAILSGGRLLTGHIGRAGHVGHVSLDPDGPPTIAGMPGGLELAIGDCSVAERTGGRFPDTRALVAAHLEGDAEASAVWLTSVRRLAAGIASIVNVVDPEVVVLAGGIVQAGEALFEPLGRYLGEMEWRPLGGSGVRVVAARLGDHAGAIGAARYALVREIRS